MATTADEETQAKEFLKRAEIRTMKKDLLALREVDSLKERDKIIKLRTLEEQLEEKKKANELAAAKNVAEKIGREEVLQKNEGQEKIAEKDLKNYATEPERQQIFLLESQRLGFEKQIDEIDKKKDPALKLEKNRLLLQRRDQQAKLNAVLEEEKKLEDEQKFITEKEQTTIIASQRKSLGESRWDLDEKIKGVEEKRWAIEKAMQDIDVAVNKIDASSDNLVTEKNGLRDKNLGVDKSLRDIYSVIMAREEEKRKGLAAEQVAKREALATVRAAEKEKVQRQQWSPMTVAKNKAEEESYLNKVPKPARERLMKSSEKEEEERKKFLHDVENWDKKKESPGSDAKAPVPTKK